MEALASYSKDLLRQMFTCKGVQGGGGELVGRVYAATAGICPGVNICWPHPSRNRECKGGRGRRVN